MSAHLVKEDGTIGLGVSTSTQQTPLAAPRAVRNARSQHFAPTWETASTPVASPVRLPPISTQYPQQPFGYTYNGSPFASPIASSGSYSGFVSTPSSEVSTSSSLSSLTGNGGDKRMYVPMSPMDPSPVHVPYQGFYSHALDNEPGFETLHHSRSAAALLSGPLTGQADFRGNGYFDLLPSALEETSPLQVSIANFERLFGNWRMWIDGGRATEAGAAQLRGQMDAAFMRMMDLAREKEASFARKRVNSITSTPNPAPIKLRRETNGMRPPPLMHAHTSPVVPTAMSAAPSSMPAFMSKASSATPAAQATVDGVHFSTATPSTPVVPVVMPSPVQHTPHTPSPLSAGIMAPMVMQQAETQLNTALASGLPSSISAPSSPRLRSELAQALYDDNGPHAAAVRQPPNPRAVQATAHSRETMELASPGSRNDPAPMALPRPSLTLSSSSLASQNTTEDDDDDAMVTPSGSPRDTDDEDDEDGMSVDVPVRRGGPMISTGPVAAEPIALTSASRARLDKIMADFLNKLCNDYKLTDSKGELVHQRLMATKMEKLTESGDFRPFKFRIQAFTNAYSDEVAAAGVDEKEVTYKVLRQYLWQHPLISRFNDEGKKAKSKGNHIWTIEARRDDDNHWHFKEFPRRIVLPILSKPIQPGTEWSWQPRVWDPQGIKHHASFELNPRPAWLEWNVKTHEYVGRVPMDIKGPMGPIEVIATYEFDGVDFELRSNFTLAFTTDEKPEKEKMSRSRTTSSAPKPTPGLLTGDMMLMESNDKVPPVEVAPETPLAVKTLVANASRPSTQPNSPVNGAFSSQVQPFDLSPVLVGTPHPLQVPQPPLLDPMLTEPLQGSMTDIVSYLPSLHTGQSGSMVMDGLAPLQQMAAGATLLSQAPMTALGLAPSALTAAAMVTEPSLGDLLAPINLLKEEMSAVEQRPGPIESAVMRHSEMQQTLAAGPPAAIARQTLDQLTEAQHQVSQAVSAAQGSKLHNLMQIDVAQAQALQQSVGLSGTLAPPPTPALGIDPSGVHLFMNQ